MQYTFIIYQSVRIRVYIEKKNLKKPYKFYLNEQIHVQVHGTCGCFFLLQML